MWKTTSWSKNNGVFAQNRIGNQTDLTSIVSGLTKTYKTQYIVTTVVGLAAYIGPYHANFTLITILIFESISKGTEYFALKQAILIILLIVAFKPKR